MSSVDIPRFGDVLTVDGKATIEYHVFLEELASGEVGAIEVQDEGAVETVALSTLDFVGSGVAAVESTPGVITVTIGGGGTTTWGDVIGTLANQTDLQAALDAKAASSHVHSTNNITTGVFIDARIQESNVTQHEAALSILETQISTPGANVGDKLIYDGTNWTTDMTQLIKQVDDVDGITIYIGEAQPTTVTSAAAWRIKRTVFTGDDSETLYAGGTSNFNSIWDNRVGLSYS